jgi:molecular chaperone IbpA
MTRFDTTFFDAIENMMLGNIEHLTRPVKNFLPYDVVQRDEDARIVINVAVSGYSKDNLDVTWNDGMLTVEGKGLPYAEEFKVVYSGLSKRAFKAQFPVSPLYQVQEVTLNNGILSAILERNEDMIKKVEIKDTSDNGFAPIAA